MIFSSLTQSWYQNTDVFSFLPLPPPSKQHNVVHRQCPPPQLYSLLTLNWV
jgi:hypothetical protein